MSDMKPASGKRLTTALLGAMAAVLVVSIIAYPDQAFAASLQGLTVWWKYVFPALLPFLMLSEMLLGFGVVHALGTLFEPFMRSLLRIPGVGGWALALGGTVGHPAGARATASLRKQGLLSRSEAERLLALSHLSSPYFIVTIVGVGFLHNARLGLVLAGVHAAALLAVGLTLRLWPEERQHDQLQPANPVTAAPHQTETERFLLRRSFEAMLDAHSKDGRAFGKLLGDAVASSVQTLMMVGGYMIIFSVVVQIIDITKLAAALQAAAAYAAGSDALRPAVRSFVSGLLEVHLGSYSFGEQSGLVGAPLAAAVAAVLGWGGLSSHIQAKGLTHDAQLRYMPFLTARLLHAVYSFLIVYAIWEPISGWLGAAPSFAGERTGPLAAAAPAGAYPQPLAACFAAAMVVSAMLAVSLLLQLIGSRYRKPV